MRVLWEGAKELRRMHQTIDMHVKRLLNMGISSDNVANVCTLVNKLTPDIRKAWEKEVVRMPRDAVSGKAEYPSLPQLLAFVHQKARELEHIPVKQMPKKDPPKRVGAVQCAHFVALASCEVCAFGYTAPGKGRGRGAGRGFNPGFIPHPPVPGASQKCPHCSADHKLWSCEKFKALGVPARKVIASKHRLCFNCLGTGHTVPKCPSKLTCRTNGCGKKHHTLIHTPGADPAGQS